MFRKNRINPRIGQCISSIFRSTMRYSIDGLKRGNKTLPCAIDL